VRRGYGVPSMIVKVKFVEYTPIAELFGITVSILSNLIFPMLRQSPVDSTRIWLVVDPGRL